jgi:hypothetical protein
MEVTTSNYKVNNGPWNAGLLKSNHLIQLQAQEYFIEISHCGGFDLCIIHFSEPFKMLPAGCFYTAGGKTWVQHDSVSMVLW